MNKSTFSARVATLGGGRPSHRTPKKPEEKNLFFGAGRKVPLVLQTESAECGLACVAMIAGYHGCHLTMAELRRRFSLSLKGITAAHLIEITQSLGLQSRPLRLDLDEVDQLQTPCILHWDLDHFVVLQRANNQRFTILDPASGERHLNQREFARHFTGVALELAKTPAFERKAPPPPISLKKLAGTVDGLGKAVTQIIGLALVLEICAILAPLFLQIVVDQVLAGGDIDLLAFLGISFALLTIFQTAVSALRSWTTMWVSTHFNMAWTGNVFAHLLRLPQAYFMKRHLGDVVSRFGAVGTIQQTLTTRFVEVVMDGVMSLLTLGMMLVYSSLLTAVAVAIFTVYVGLRVLYYRVLYAANLDKITVAAVQQTNFMESVRGVQTIRLHNQTPAQTARFLNVTADTINTSIAVQRLQLLFGSANSLVNGFQRIAVLWLGAWLAMRDAFSAGMLIAFVAYADQFSSRTGNLVDYLINLKLLRMQGERLADIVLTPPEKDAESPWSGPSPSPTITFRNVSFRYADGEPWILRNCSFTVEEGESVTIVGPSGCGKSTLIRLMLGLLDPQAGSIEVGGIDLRQLGKIKYRAMLGAVMQDDILFSGTIADNISFFDQSAETGHIEQAARLAQIHDDIIAMPMGYHSLVGDMGSSLSGGQMQRLFLARALYRSPHILILDEATSHVDVACEGRIFDAIAELATTKIQIAHRPEVAARADRVLQFYQGSVIAMELSAAAQTELQATGV
jgi:ATP-binding cassette, subfamily B, bacterial CvaB/MchF/RaxB